MNFDDIKDKEPFSSDPELKTLFMNMLKLKEGLDKLTWEKYHRINPFIENLFDWKMKGEKLFGKGKNITVYDTCSISGDVEVGNNTWIGPYSAIDGGGGVRIGSFCSISSKVNIVSHDSVKFALSGGKFGYEYAPIKIGNYCFIGTGAMITKGVTIGDHCLIGAGAVVTKDIPNFSIVYGVPGRIVGTVRLEEDNVFFDYI